MTEFKKITQKSDFHNKTSSSSKTILKLQRPCNSCIHECTKIINEGQRQQILRYFHNLRELSLQQLFLQKCIEQVKDGDKTLYRFFFTINGRRIRVCKLFFLTTLSVNTNFIAEALNAVLDEKIGEDENEKYVHPKIIEGVINHIKSIPRIISCEIDSKGEREYIETSINVHTMYQLYIKYCKEHSYPQTTFEIYQGIFSSQNEAFKKCRESLPPLNKNEVTIITLRADEKNTQSK